MTRGTRGTPISSGSPALRLQARLNEVERQLQSQCFRLAAAHWLVAPVAILLVAYLGSFIYRLGLPSTENLVAALMGGGGALATGIAGYRSVRREIAALEEERRELEALLLGAGG